MHGCNIVQREQLMPLFTKHVTFHRLHLSVLRNIPIIPVKTLSVSSMWIVLRTHTSVACFAITFQKINWCIKMSTVIVTSLHFIQLKKLRIKIKLS